MLKPLLFILTVLLSGIIDLHGQEDYPPCSAYDSIGKDTICAINSFGNNLYIGIDNEIKLSEKYFENKNILLKCSPGKIIVDSPLYLVYPSKNGTAIILVYQNNFEDSNIVYKKLFNVLSVPAPAITVGHIPLNTINEISRSELIHKGKFEVHVSDDIIDDHDWFFIKEITLGYSIGPYYKTVTCQGDKFSDEMISAISRLTPGKEVSFAFIILGQGDIYIRVAPIKLRVY
jgi:hypothetical protein